MSSIMPSFTQNDTAFDPNAERKARFAEHTRKFINTVVKSCLDTWSPISVSLHSHSTSPAPAWSTPTLVGFDESALRFETLTDIASNKGLSVHEMLHIIYTPRKGAGVTKFAIENGYTRELNILEDQRIETLATGRWGRSARLWLTPTILTHLLSDEQQLSTALILTHGRKYLPLDVRQAVADQFISPELAPDIVRVIDEYITLVYPRDNARGEALLEEFYLLLNKMPKPVSNDCGGGSSQESGSVRPLPQSEQSKDAQRVPQSGEVSLPQPSEPTADQPNGQPTDDSSDSTDSTTSTSSGQSDDGNDSGGQNAGNTPSNDTATNNAPSTPTAGNGVSKDDTPSVSDVLRDALNQSVAEQRDDIVNDANAINGIETPINGKTADLIQAPFEMTPVSPESAQASNAFARVLEELMSKHESGWNRQVSSGKVNLGRWLGGCDFDEAFDRFEVGREDAVDIEAVIVLDTSGSMDDVRTEAFEAMWAIKRALDTVNASTTVLTFASDSRVLYNASDSATNQMRWSSHSGSTNPLNALRKTVGIMAESTRAVKVVLTITDGSWGDSATEDKIIRDLRLGGVLTGLVNLDLGCVLTDTHEFELVANISDVRGILSLGRELVATATARNLGN